MNDCNTNRSINRGRVENPNNNAKHFTYEWVTHYFLTFLNKLCCIIYNRNYVITLEEIYAKN